MEPPALCYATVLFCDHFTTAAIGVVSLTIIDCVDNTEFTKTLPLNYPRWACKLYISGTALLQHLNLMMLLGVISFFNF